MGSRFSISDQVADEAVDFGLRAGTALLGMCSVVLVTFGVYIWVSVEGAVLLHWALVGIGACAGILSAMATVCLPRQSRRFMLIFIVGTRALCVVSFGFAALFLLLSHQVVAWSSISIPNQPLAESITRTSGVLIGLVGLILALDLCLARRAYATLLSAFAPIGSPRGSRSGGGRLTRPGRGGRSDSVTRDSARFPAPGSARGLDKYNENGVDESKYGSLDDVYSSQSVYRFGETVGEPGHRLRENRDEFGSGGAGQDDYALDNSLFDSQNDDEESAMRSKYAQLYEKYSLA